MYKNFTLLSGDNYFPTMRDVQITSMTVVPIGDCGVAGSVVLSDGTNDINAVAAAAALAGVPLNGVKDVDNGSITIPAGGVLKFVVSSTNSVAFGCTVDVDPYLKA